MVQVCLAGPRQDPDIRRVSPRFRRCPRLPAKLAGRPPDADRSVAVVISAAMTWDR